MATLTAADRRQINEAIKFFRDEGRQKLLDVSARNLMNVLRDDPVLSPTFTS
jgi:hypothetical protein